MSERFTEEEVQKILARSLRLQDASLAEVAKNREGFSIDELEEVAMDLGISKEFLHEALKSKSDSFVFTLRKSKLGGIKEFEVSGNVRTRITEDAKFEILQLLRKELKGTGPAKGTVENIGSSFEWTIADYTFTANAGDGETDLKLVHRPGGMKLLFNLVPIIFGATALPIAFGVGGPVAGMAILTVWVALTIIFNGLFKSRLKRQTKLSQEVFQSIEEIVMRHSSSGNIAESAEEEASDKASRIDLQGSEGYDLSQKESRNDGQRIKP